MKTNAPVLAQGQDSHLRISVALCTYNGASYLSDQLTSIASQTRLPDEIVICDDGSSDDSLQIATALGDIYPFSVVVHRNSTNLGSIRNFEKAIGLCSGDVVALSDQDDIWHPEKLARIEAAFVSAIDLGALFSDANLVDEKGVPINRSLWESVGFSRRLRAAVKEGNGFDALLLGNFVTGATLAFRTKWNSLLFPIPSGWVHDYWIALMLSAVSRLDAVDEPLISYRCHPSQERGVKEPSLYEFWRRFAGLQSTSYSEAARLQENLADRLRRFDSRRFAAQIEKCEAMAIHMKRRSALPSSRLSRIPIITREILNRNYFRHSSGVRSILRDVAARY